MDSVTTYSFKDIEPEEYRRDTLTPHQIAKQRAVLQDTPDPDILEHVTIDGVTTTYEQRVNPDGSVTKVPITPPVVAPKVPTKDSNESLTSA